VDERELVTDHLVFQVFHRHLSGEVLRYHHMESLERADLPGGDGTDLWVGMALGQAGQVTQSGSLAFSGVLNFRPYVWFEGSGFLPGEIRGRPGAALVPDGDRTGQCWVRSPVRPLRRRSRTAHLA
jgi:hypothetical protein